MNQSKFSLADIFNVSGTLGFGFLCFLSFNFISLGETGVSILLAAVFALPLGGFAFWAKRLKMTDRPSKSKIIGEGILLICFGIIAFVAIFPFSHFFAVYEQKAGIQEKLTANIEQAAGMFDNYEDYVRNRMDMYMSRLISTVNAKGVNPSEYNSYGFEVGTDDGTQIRNKIFILSQKLRPSNYSDSINNNGMKEVAVAWLTKAKNTSESNGAFIFGIVDVVNHVESKTNSWKNDLKRLSEFHAKGENAEDFDYPLTFNDVTDKLTEFYIPTLLSIIFALGLYILMLLSYFITKRHTRWPGLKVIFGTGGVRENEL